MVSQCKIDYKVVLSLFHPKGILEYFEIVYFSNIGSYYLIYLEENYLIPESLKSLDPQSKEFYSNII